MHEENKENGNRRSFLKGVGSAALIPLLANVKPVKADSVTHWDEEADVVVVGTGGAGFSAALFAHEEGSKVIMLEKGPAAGGTTIRSGGVAYIPNNHLLRKAGVSDKKEDFLRFAVRVTYPTTYHPDLPRFGASEEAYALLDAYYDNAASTAQSLEDMGAVKYTTLLDHDMKPFADNYGHIAENQCSRGRAICCIPETIQEGRYYYPNNGGFGVDLISELLKAANKRRIPILTRHTVKNVVVNSNDEVIGVIVSTRKGEKKIGARRGVIFGSGGFVQNEAYRQRYLPGRVYGGCATPTNQGDFLRIAGGVGASMGNLENGWGMELLLEEAVASSDVKTGIWVIPGDSSILVNRYGHRFVNEKNQPCGRAKLHAAFDPVAVEYPNLIGIMIWDQRAVDLFGGIYGIQPKTGALPSHVIEGSTLAKLEKNIASRLKTLEQHTGNVSLSDDFEESLKHTLEVYNGYAKAGKDKDFHRGDNEGDRSFHYYGGVPKVENPYPNDLMHPITMEGPFFATLVAAGAIDSKGGPQVNGNAQVLGTDGEPIAGLYAAGNCIASPAAGEYWGAGGTIGPAMVFGKIAAINAAHAPLRSLTKVNNA